MTEDPMIVRVAKAIASNSDNADWRVHIATARSAVKAMRQPTRAMLEAAMSDLPDWGFLPDEWQAMIDYVTSEKWT